MFAGELRLNLDPVSTQQFSASALLSLPVSAFPRAPIALFSVPSVR